MGITFDAELVPQYIYKYDSKTETFSDNLSGASNFDYFNDDAQAGDCIYFNIRRGWRFPWHNLKFYIGQSLVADSINIVWEYYSYDGWKELPNVVDETNNFTASGEKWVKWDVPEYPIHSPWRSTKINAKDGFWVRGRIESVTNITEGGAQTTQPVTLQNFAITVTGYSEATPCTLEDIYQADVNNGWGRFRKLNDVQYECDCNLVVGDWDNSGDESWLIPKNKSLVVHGVLQVIEYGNFQTGELVDLETRRCRYGSHLHFTRKYCKGSFYSWYASPFGGTYSTIRNRVLSSLITGEAYAPYCCSLFLSSIRDGSTILPYKLAEDAIVNRATLYSSGHAIDARDATYEDIYVHDSDRAIRLPSNTSATVRNLKVRNCTYMFRHDGSAGQGAHLYVIDADTDTWNIYFSNANNTTEVYQQYSMNIKIIDEQGNPIEGAIVRLLNNSGELIFEQITGTDGRISEQIVTSHKYVHESGCRPGVARDINYNPFTIIINKEGFLPYSKVFELNEKVVWEPPLKRANVNIDQEVLL